MDARQVLAGVRARLAAGEEPQAVIDSLLPATPAAAEAWARRLPLWAEYAGEYGAQPAALARVVSKRGMRLHGLALDEHGGVAPGADARPGPAYVFSLDIGGVPVAVTYTPGYFLGTDHLQFTGPGDPPAPHALSESGHWSHFTPSAGVAAQGGPVAYARAYADAGPDRDRVFHATFVGEQGRAKAVRGKHTARAVRQEASSPPPEAVLPEPECVPAPPPAPVSKTQRTLF